MSCTSYIILPSTVQGMLKYGVIKCGTFSFISEAAHCSFLVEVVRPQTKNNSFNMQTVWLWRVGSPRSSRMTRPESKRLWRPQRHSTQPHTWEKFVSLLIASIWAFYHPRHSFCHLPVSSERDKIRWTSPSSSALSASVTGSWRKEQQKEKFDSWGSCNREWCRYLKFCIPCTRKYDIYEWLGINWLCIWAALLLLIGKAGICPFAHPIAFSIEINFHTEQKPHRQDPINNFNYLSVIGHRQQSAPQFCVCHQCGRHV